MTLTTIEMFLKKEGSKEALGAGVWRKIGGGGRGDDNVNPMNQNKGPSPVKQTEDRVWLDASEISF